MNNPIKLVDPTGHKCVGDSEECLDDDGNAMNGAGGLPPKPDHRGSGGAGTCSGPNPSIVCLPPPGANPPLPPLQSASTANQSVPDMQDFDTLAWFTKHGLEFIDYLSSYEDIVNAYKPVYKQVKYGFGTGGIEAVIDASIYGLKDRWSTSLTNQQRMGRMVVVGTQSFLVDRLSDKAGLLGVPFGGKAGEVGVQYIVSNAISEFILPKTTNWVFNKFNLGVPLDVSPLQ